jgi:hypothetical protein
LERRFDSFFRRKADKMLASLSTAALDLLTEEGRGWDSTPAGRPQKKEWRKRG